MDVLLKEKLNALPSLERPSNPTPTCKICGSPAYLFDVVDFNKCCFSDYYRYGRSGIDVPYFKCHQCNFLFTDFFDNWSNDEISKFIYNDDYLKVDPDYSMKRPLETALSMRDLLDGCESLRILDYGSGSGLFSRHMEEFGFKNVVNYDPYSHPVRPQGVFDLITAFEVVEHSPRPLETFREMAAFMSEAGAMIVGQTLQPSNIEELKCSWWYAAPRNGHVSTYSITTFSFVAQKLGLDLRGKPIAGVFGLARPSLLAILAAPMDKIGPRYVVTVLKAPITGPRTDQWHEIETYSDTAQFRWTASNRLIWKDCPLMQGHNRIEVPFLMEIQAEFARACRLVVDGKELTTSVVKGRLTAELYVESSTVAAVELITPEPIRPRAVSQASDLRRLGLAVLVEPPKADLSAVE